MATCGFLLFILVIVGMPGMLRPLNTFRIYYDNASGIRPGAPVLLAGREIGKVTGLDSPVPLEKRPAGHPNYEVSINVQVSKSAEVYHNATVRLAQQGLMGQQAIDFVQGDATSGLAEDHCEFVGSRVPDIAESVNAHVERLAGPESDLAQAIKNAKIFIAMLNHSKISQAIKNAEQFTDTLKREPWRVLWPSSKAYEGDKEAATRKETARERKDRIHRADEKAARAAR